MTKSTYTGHRLSNGKLLFFLFLEISHFYFIYIYKIFSPLDLSSQSVRLHSCNWQKKRYWHLGAKSRSPYIGKQTQDLIQGGYKQGQAIITLLFSVVFVLLYPGLHSSSL